MSARETAPVVLLPSGGAIVIDSGWKSRKFDIGSSIVAPVLWRAGRTGIDTFYATHGDSDHIGGAMGLIDRLPTDRITPHLISSRRYAFSNLRAWALLNGVYSPVSAGDEIVHGKLRVKVLNPPDGHIPYKRNPNNLSMVLKLIYGKTRILMMADTTKKTERWLMDSGAKIEADIIKIGHHGSKSSSSLKFLKRVGAKYGVISAGYKNRFGHPHKNVLANIKKADMKVYITGQHGEIVVRTDGG